MDTKEAVETIRSNLLAQPSWIINDIKTFQYLRWNKPGLIEREKLGGGNILSILGLFSVLNYLGKIYKTLQSGKIHTRETNADDKKYFTEEQAFKRLNMDCPFDIVNPKNDINLTNIWKIFRNTLAHTAQIPQGNQALVLIQDAHNIPPDLPKKLIKESPDKAFTQISTDCFVCVVDRLILDVEDILGWVVDNLDKKFEEDNIGIASKWIKGSASV